MKTDFNDFINDENENEYVYNAYVDQISDNDGIISIAFDSENVNTNDANMIYGEFDHDVFYQLLNNIFGVDDIDNILNKWVMLKLTSKLNDYKVEVYPEYYENNEPTADIMYIKSGELK